LRRLLLGRGSLLLSGSRLLLGGGGLLLGGSGLLIGGSHFSRCRTPHHNGGAASGTSPHAHYRFGVRDQLLEQ
jgi:hypothetical protein